MKLSSAQCDELDAKGFLVIENVFNNSEVDAINARMPSIFAQQTPANIIEKSSGAVRTAMGLHKRDALFSDLVRHPRLIEPALQILKEAIYVQQVKVNVKAAFSGEVWQWHYDFATHHEEDGVPEPLALNLHIFLDDVNEFNGPLYFLPGSHRPGPHKATLDTSTTSYPLWVVDDELVTRMVNDTGMVSAKGKRGTMLIFHDTLVHASPNNMSPWDRSIFSLIVNPVSNALTRPTRPGFKHHQDLTPVTAISDDCLERYQ